MTLGLIRKEEKGNFKTIVLVFQKFSQIKRAQRKKGQWLNNKKRVLAKKFDQQTPKINLKFLPAIRWFRSHTPQFYPKEVKVLLGQPSIINNKASRKIKFWIKIEDHNQQIRLIYTNNSNSSTNKVYYKKNNSKEN